MSNKKDHSYLLSDLTKLKGVEIKFLIFLKRKKLILSLIYYGNYQNLIR